MSKTWYTGIADNEGIESFEPMAGVTEHEMSLFQMRAVANPQRFATVYKAELDKETIKNVTAQLENNNYINALKSLYNGIKTNNLEAEATNKKYWNLITKHSNTLTKITKGDK